MLATRLVRVVLMLLLVAWVASPSFAQNNPLHFSERTQIEVATSIGGLVENDPFLGVDNSTFLGSPNLNFSATVDAATADINQDGYPDIAEYNAYGIPSGAPGYGAGLVLRINNQVGGFDSILVETTLAVSGSGPIKMAFADLNGDTYPDLILAGADNGVFFNSGNAATNYFDLGSPDFSFPIICGSGVAVGHLNNDGALDFAISKQTTGVCAFLPPPLNLDPSVTKVYFNNVAGHQQGIGDLFTEVAQLPAPINVSTEDVVFIDANNDTLLDVATINRGPNSSQVFLNNGFTISTVADLTLTHATWAESGAASDLNGDGNTDLVIVGITPPSQNQVLHKAEMFLNDGQPGSASFSTVEIMNVGEAYSRYHDLKVEDIDNDGDADIIFGTSVRAIHLLPLSGIGGLQSLDAGRVFALLSNGGSVPTFNVPGSLSRVELVPTDIFINQTLSVELLDYDGDGDLDVYAAGGEDQPLLLQNGFEGAMPNQFFENLTVAPDFDGDGVADIADNCLEVPNAPSPFGNQLDTDLDGLGNACDADYNQDGFVTGADFGPFYFCFLGGAAPITGGQPDDPTCEESDSNGDGFITGTDFGPFYSQFLLGLPGVSGLDCQDPTINIDVDPNSACRP